MKTVRLRCRLNKHQTLTSEDTIFISKKSQCERIELQLVCQNRAGQFSPCTSQNLPYSKFLMYWVHWYEFTSRFASIRGRVSLSNNLLQTSYSTLFFVWVFPWGFSYKIFNEAISIQDYVISSIFPPKVFGGRYWDIRCIALFSLCEFSIYGFSYKVFDEAMSTRYMLYHLFSPLGFLEDDIWCLLTIWSRCF
jgi:hypothetical protein